MDLIEAFKTRRSIRRFLNNPVSQEDLEFIFHAAMEAPSPKNSQPWHFVVFEGKKRDALIAKIATIVAEERNQGRANAGIVATVRVLEQAPVIIFVYNRATSRYPDEPDPIIARVIDVQSIGASIEHLLLAAHQKGLGTLWVCDILDVPPVMELLQSDQELVAAIAIGYPDEIPPRPPRQSLEDIVSWRID